MGDFYSGLINQIKEKSIEDSKDVSIFIEEITQKMLQFRKQVDSEFNLNGHSYDLDLRIQGIRTINTYPIGFCDFISDRIYNLIKDELIFNDSIFYKLKQNGIVIKRLFGILDGKVIHNAFQIGNYFVDISHDTVVGNSNQLYYNKIKNVNFKQIENYDELFKVMKKYWGVEIYPNKYFPEISFIFPYLLKYVDGQIHIKGPHLKIPVYEDMQKDYIFAREFILNSNMKLDSKYFKKLNLARANLINFLTRVEIPIMKTDETLKEYFKRLIIFRENIGKEKFDSILYNKSEFIIPNFNAFLNK